MPKDNGNGFKSYAKQKSLIASENLGSSKFFVVQNANFKKERTPYFICNIKLNSICAWHKLDYTVLQTIWLDSIKTINYLKIFIIDKCMKYE